VNTQDMTREELEAKLATWKHADDMKRPVPIRITDWGRETEKALEIEIAMPGQAAHYRWYWVPKSVIGSKMNQLMSHDVFVEFWFASKNGMPV